MLHQMHVEIVETKKRKEDLKISKKPFVYKETDFPTILSSERKKPNSHLTSGGNLNVLITHERQFITVFFS